MKTHLMIFGLIAMVAMTGGAVTIDWTYDGDGTETSVGLVYFADSGKTLSASDFDASGNLTSGDIVSTADLDDGGGTYSPATMPSTGSYYIVLFNNNDKTASWSDKITASELAAYDKDQGAQFIATGGKAIGDIGTITFSGWQAVPEPTSVALLLLGVAAFGCKRRKFAL